MPASETATTTTPESETAILCYGDSQAEVFDYVFHGHKSYVQYAEDARVGWRSGWSTRGLGAPEHVQRLVEPLKELPPHIRHAFVILGFGSVDIEWNLSYKRYKLKQDVDLDQFLGEALDALDASVTRIVATGEQLRQRTIGGPQVHILLSFPFVPLPLSDTYMEEFDRKYGGGDYPVLPHAERCALWSRFCDAASKRICSTHPDAVRLIDVRADFERDGFDAYTCDEEDHHPNLAKTQHIVARQVRSLSFGTGDGSHVRLEPAEWPHEAMYPHVRRRFEKAKPPAAADTLATACTSPRRAPLAVLGHNQTTAPRPVQQQRKEVRAAKDVSQRMVNAPFGHWSLAV